MNETFLYRDGGRVAVARPVTRELAAKAVALAKQAVQKNDAALLNAIPSLIEHYRLVGFASTEKPFILDQAGERVGRLEPGDTFFGEADLAKMSLAQGSDTRPN